MSRRPSRFAYGVSPIYAARAQGARMWDVDGNEFIDWVSGIGAIILGYADPVVDQAVCTQIQHGNCFSINHELEIELAEELTRLVPCAEMVRYAKCGGEACAIAVRIARGYTGRDKVLFCGYHGWHDWYLAANLDQSASLDAHLFPGIEPIGVPSALAGTAIPFPYGDVAALEKQLAAHAGQTACVILEPLRSEMPPEGYLNQVIEVAHAHGAVVIFDEVSTGFRFSPGGVQPVVGAVPDIAVFAKSISNGYPMGAVVGRRKVMEPAAQMFISSTYWSDTIGLRAALTTLREVERRGVPEALKDFGATLKQRVAEAAGDSGLPVRCDGVDVHPKITFTVDDPQILPKLTTLYIQEMARRGCHCLPSFYLNASQAEPELEQTTAALREVFALLNKGLQENRIDQLLECAPAQDAFRRLVR